MTDDSVEKIIESEQQKNFFIEIFSYFLNRLIGFKERKRKKKDENYF